MLLERLLTFSIVIACMSWIARRLPALPPPPPPPDVFARSAHDLALLEIQLLGAVESNASADELETLLSRAAPGAHRKRLANSVKYGEDHSLKSALFLACANRSPGNARALLNSGANASVGRVDEGTTPMHIAAGWIHSERVVEVLLAAPDRADVVRSLQSKPLIGGLKRQTPIFWASHYGHERTMLRLISWMRDEGGGWRYRPDTDDFERGSSLHGPPLPPRPPLPPPMSPEEAIAALSEAGGASEGFVSLAELGTLLRLLGANPTEAEVVEYRQILRDAGYHAVTASAIEKLLIVHDQLHPPSKEREENEKAWQAIDEDGDGVLQGSELTQLVKLLTTVGEPLTDEETAEFIAELDADSNGIVRREEYERWLGEVA